MDRIGVRKIGNAIDATTGVMGIITTLAAATGTLLHTMPTGRTARITKICAYNGTGADVPLLFGTRNRATPAAFAQMLPDLIALDAGMDNEWVEEELPMTEFASWPALTAAGRTGSIYVVAGTVAAPVAGVIVSIEVEEFGR